MIEYKSSKVALKCMALVLEMSLAVRCFLILDGLNAITIWGVFILNGILAFLGLGRQVDRLMFRKFNREGISIERTIQMLVHLPAQKCLQFFLLTFVYSLLCSAVFAFLYGIRGVQLHIPMVAWTIISFCSAAEAYVTSTRETSDYFEDLVASSGNEVRHKLFEYNKRKFLGMPLDIQFGVFVLMPIVLCFMGMILLITEDLYVPDFRLWQRMIIMATLTVIMVVGNSLNFFMYVKRTARRIESVIDKIQQGEGYVPERADASTEIAYTKQLVDNIHNRISRDQQETEQKKQSLEEKLQNLLSFYPVIDDLLKNEQEALESALTQLEKMDTQNASIHTQIKESRQIARKTSETVGVSQKALSLNEQKIHEIAVSNKTATGGIQSLSNKINGIWEIVDLIDSIADQTKIIAFNAELESEKIDHNREKFKNVAYAIRNLTDQVLTLTGKIRSDIKKIQEASNALLVQGKEGTSYIENGTTVAGQLAATLKVMESSADESAILSETVQDMIENFTGQVVGLQKQLSKTLTQIESYKESIRDEIELAGIAGRVIGVEE